MPACAAARTRSSDSLNVPSAFFATIGRSSSFMSRSCRATTSCTASRRFFASGSCSAVIAQSVSRRFFRSASVSAARALSMSGFIVGSGFFSNAATASRRFATSVEASCSADNAPATFARSRLFSVIDCASGASTALPVSGSLLPSSVCTSTWPLSVATSEPSASALSTAIEGASALATSLSMAADLASKSSAPSGARSSAVRAANAASGAQASNTAQSARRAARARVFPGKPVMMAFQMRLGVLVKTPRPACCVRRANIATARLSAQRSAKNAMLTPRANAAGTPGSTRRHPACPDCRRYTGSTVARGSRSSSSTRR